MRKIIFNLFLLSVSIQFLWAERVDVCMARQVATTMGVRMKGNASLRAAAEPELVFVAIPGNGLSNFRSSDFNGEADYYVFNYPNHQGFVIVSGEDRAFPVLGYADQGEFTTTDMPENIVSWLRSYQDQISEVVKQDWEASETVESEWNSYLQAEASFLEEKEVVLKTANWGQTGAYISYSKGFPEMMDGSGKAITGCVSTAMGIIMKYHEYPQRTTGKGVTEFVVEKGASPIQIDYAGDYDWNNILMDYEGTYTVEQAEEVSRLLWHAGVNVKTIYDSYENEGSAAETKDAIKALVNVFGYSSSIRYVFKNQYNWKEWKQMIHQEIDANRPIVYGNKGHQFVCDGYNTYDYFHINWGWDGDCNGFYRLSVMSNNYMPEAYLEQDMVINIIPKAEEGLLVPYEPKFIFDEVKNENNKIIVSVSLAYLAFELSDHFFVGMGIVDAQGKIVNIPQEKDEFTVSEELLEKKIYDDFVYTVNASVLKAGEMFVPMYSRDEKNWRKISSFRDEDSLVVLGVNAQGVVYRNDSDSYVSWPTITKNEFSESELKRVDFKDLSLNEEESLMQNTKAISFLFPLVGQYEVSCEIADYINWAKHLRVSWGTNPDQMESMDDVISIDGVFSFFVSASEIQEGNYTTYLRIMSDQVGVLPYTLKVSPVKNDKILDPMLVTKELAFTISENPTSNELLSIEETRVWSSPGVIHLQLRQPNEVCVFTISGTCVNSQSLSAGTTDLSLVPGFYIVRLGEQSYKIVVP